jgi:4-hydroxybenzoate polyprenyltransferase
VTGDLGPWRGYLQLLRLPAVFSAWSNVFAGHLIATMGAGESPRWGLLALQIGIATCLYLGGMVLNDCFDLEEDRIQRPSRPLPSGQVPVPSAWRLGFGLLLAGTALGIVAGGETLWLTLGIAAAVLLYDGVLKAGPLGPLAMGLCRYLNWLMALSAAPLTQVSLALAAPALIYTGGVTALSRAETGGALVGPLRWTWLALAGTLATMAGLFLAGGLPEPAGLVAVLILVAFVGVRLLRLRPRGEGAGDATLVQAGVRTLLLGMIPLDAALLLGAGLWVPALLLPSLLIPARRLGRWLYLT